MSADENPGGELRAANKPPDPVYTTIQPGWRPPPVAVAAAQVLDYHTGLHDLLARPNAAVLSIIRQFAEHVSDTDLDGSWSDEVFYPFYRPGRPAEPGWEARFAGAIARGLFTATTYQVTTPMCEIAEALYEQTADNAGHIDEGDLPAECGFLWLDQPFRRGNIDDQAMQIRAVTWSPQTIRYGGEPYRGVRVTCWSQWEIDPAGQDLRAGETPEERSARGRLWTALGPLTLCMTVTLPFGQRFGTWTATGSLPSALHYVHALWLLLGTEITAISRAADISRSARRRALRSIQQNDVAVILLRRSHPLIPGGERGHRDVDWSCRWLVRGFWRHIEDYAGLAERHHAVPDGSRTSHRGYELCAVCAAEITKVKTHIRGPEDRPLRAHRGYVERLSR